MKKLGDNCDHCQRDYTFDSGTDHLAIYKKHPHYSHVYAVCPHCQSTTHIFLEGDAVGLIVLSDQVPIYHYDTVPQEIIEMRNALDEDVAQGEGIPLYHDDSPGDLPWPPRTALMELWNTMRHFGGECGPKCLFPECKGDL